MQQLRKEFQQAKSILQLMLEREQLNDVISQNLQLYVYFLINFLYFPGTVPDPKRDLFTKIERCRN